MEGKSKYYTCYRFNDGTTYKTEIGKDSVSESDMRNLRRVIKGQDKVNIKMAKLETVSLEEIISSVDKHSALSDECVDAELLIEAADEYDSLHRAIKKLLPQQQALVQKVFFQGMPQTEVAAELGITKQALQRRLSKVYAQLKKHL